MPLGITRAGRLSCAKEWNIWNIRFALAWSKQLLFLHKNSRTYKPPPQIFWNSLMVFRTSLRARVTQLVQMNVIIWWRRSGAWQLFFSLKKVRYVLRQSNIRDPYRSPKSWFVVRSTRLFKGVLCEQEGLPHTAMVCWQRFDTPPN